ncbi:hypothetical protein CAOG_03910 [Capsaspora owczarzaki ATCC 30864]|uniref:Large ribosomal subunit protein bL21m n=1 Tax=Capsaspora owczarzaki (strain ATCC 30864) TaxID=595528 RepID=A0A0D2WQA6_CAPO3|nr:hypothetical protein CAOG_03910 [Capsaspora owczarzaki ATCC 30864]KJE93063.1 hypothetical protein CAOG_003910 [Capsaspora owczarzaki ATCC 30864]|eukprot:XP_004363638.1 hypothetical protein CAOG_03910 [Capsaspora owczarzaki ATCC 30864]
MALLLRTTTTTTVAAARRQALLFQSFAMRAASTSASDAAAAPAITQTTSVGETTVTPSNAQRLAPGDVKTVGDLAALSSSNVLQLVGAQIKQLYPHNLTRSSAAAGSANAAAAPIQRPAISSVPDTSRPFENTASQSATQTQTSSPAFVVVYVAGHQFKVSVNDTIVSNKIHCPVGTRINLEKVLMVGSADFTISGTPLVPTSVVRVQATVIEQSLAEKVIVFKKKRRKTYKKWKGHRQPITTLRITSIDLAPAWQEQKQQEHKQDAAASL